MTSRTRGDAGMQLSDCVAVEAIQLISAVGYDLIRIDEEIHCQPGILTTASITWATLTGLVKHIPSPQG